MARLGADPPPDPEHRRVRIALAGSVVGVESRSADFTEAVRRRFEPFLTECPQSFTVRHEAPTALGGPEPYTVEIDLATGTARLHDREGPEGLDGVLRLILPTLLSPMLVVHAALLGDGGRCWLCCGRSGSGKSTLARLADELALCDELAAVDTRGGSVAARSLPFTAARPGTGELAEVLLLEHGAEHRRTPVGRGEAMRELSAHVCWPQHDGDVAGAAFQSLADLVEKVPVTRLAFRPDRDVVDLITRGA